MKIVLIGGNGFIGSHIIDKLVQEKHYFITVFGHSKNPFSSLHESVEYIYGDFENIELLRKALWKADIIIHLLSTTVPLTAEMAIEHDVHSNLIGTIRLLEEVGKLKLQLKRFIYVSSGGTVYGNPEYLPIDEQHPLKPINSYGITKMAIESYVQLYAKKYNFPFMIIRPSNPYGPRQSFQGTQGVISNFLYKALNNDPIVIWGDGSSVRDYVYIDDVVDFFIKAIATNHVGIYNLGYGKGFSVNQIIKIMQKYFNNPLKIKYQESTSSTVKKVVLDTKKVYDEFHWEAKTNFDTGILKHFEWIKAQMETYES